MYFSHGVHFIVKVFLHLIYYFKPLKQSIMKLKSLLSIVALSMAALVQAQVGPGLFAGGSIGMTRGSSESVFGSTTVEGPTTTMLTFQPSIGYYFTENVGAGIRFGYSSFSSKEDVGNEEEKTSTTFVGAQIFARYASLIGGSDNFAFFGELNAGFGKVTGETELGSVTVEDDPISLVNIGIAPGIMFFPTPRYGFEASLGNIFGFTTTTQKDADDEDDKTTITEINILDLSTMGLEFGFHYYFNR